jgi:hypothetical protein
MSRNSDIIFLFGAGASVQAGIPASQQMIEKIEERLKKPDWNEFQDLYYLVKSSIAYAAGIKGIFETSDFYNVEVLVHTLNELERREKHPIYPFISDWKSHLIQVARQDFSRIESFRINILNELKGWVQLDNESEADYFKGLRKLQQHLTYPLKIFSLNYDLCVERCDGENFRVESGFEQTGKKRIWDWRRFDESNPNQDVPQVFLYKMHGSIDWKRDENDNIVKTDDKGARTPGNELPLIFGTDRKLEAGDPYLFYAYEFRRCTLECKVILCVGYGFGDTHINKMIKQALNTENLMRVAFVGNLKSDEAAKKKNWIASKLGVAVSRIQVVAGTAKSFLEDENIGKTVSALLPREDVNDPF